MEHLGGHVDTDQQFGIGPVELRAQTGTAAKIQNRQVLLQMGAHKAKQAFRGLVFQIVCQGLFKRPGTLIKNPAHMFCRRGVGCRRGPQALE